MEQQYDLKLERFGKLVAKWSFHLKDERVWKCNCDCGSICYVKERALIEGIAKSCGCREKEVIKN